MCDAQPPHQLLDRYIQPSYKPAKAPPSKDAATPSLEQIFERVTEALQREALYRDANLSLSDLAGHVASNSTYVSNAISQFANTDFNNLVNH